MDFAMRRISLDFIQDISIKIAKCFALGTKSRPEGRETARHNFVAP